MLPIEEICIPDPQAELRTKLCPGCGAVVYPPGYHCIRCKEADL